jgi:Xaa-Pro aminopeptidase
MFDAFHGVYNEESRALAALVELARRRFAVMVVAFAMLVGAGKEAFCCHARGADMRKDRYHAHE